MDTFEFTEALLGVMERKRHWAWPAFGRGEVPADRLHIHLEQEYATYVRDFPVLVGLAYVQCPIPAVRRELAENLFEEETGGLVAGRPHPALFLEYPRGLRMDLARFDEVDLLPEAASYAALLRALCGERGWEVGAAVATLFIEGTPHDRSVLDPAAPARPAPPLEEHPLVVHYGLPVEHLALTKAHRQVEGDHRDAAWRCVLDHVGAGERLQVVAAMEEALTAWLAYRDAVALACGLTRPAPDDPAPIQLVFMTCTEAEAPALVRALVDEQLIACGNISAGVQSIYRWKGEVCEDAEAAVWMETTGDRVPRLMERIVELHSYETPKVVVLEATDALAPYAAWVRDG